MKHLLKVWKDELNLEKIFTDHVYDKGLVSKKYKKLEKLNIKKSIQLENRQRYEEIFHQIIYTDGKRAQWDTV